MTQSNPPAERKILALIPAYNEGPRITTVIRGALQFLPVLVVDDGSSDQTGQAAESVPGITVLHHARNQGKGAALKTGFRWALENGYEAVIMLDADGQHDPEEIPQFLEVYRRHRSDQIIGARDYNQIPIIRRMTNYIGRWTFSWAMGQPIPDNQSGYRLVSRRLMQALLESKEQGFHFEVEMIMTTIKQGMRLDWVPIKTIYGDETSHINPIEHVPNFFRVVFKARREMAAFRKKKHAA